MNISKPGLLILILLACGQATCQRQDSQESVSQANPCDNPDADISCSFVNMPASLSNVMTIAEQDEPGEKLVISGIVFKADGKTPYPNVILYAYHTDSKGYYSKNGTETGVQKWHGRLHGWCKTDSNGQYKIQSIRPARYPGNTIPAHIHAALKTDKGQMQWIVDYVFKDDNLVNEKYLSSHANAATGVVDIKKNSENIWTGKRDIVLK